MIDEALVERAARAVHENYLRDQRAAGVKVGSAPAMRAWSQLSEELRDSNRAQVRAMSATLAAVGVSIVPAGRGDASFTFTPGELDALAQLEHARFNRRREEAGWRYGSVRDDTARRHPSLVAWEELSDAERDKDRDAVRHIPEVLARVGLAVVRRA